MAKEGTYVVVYVYRGVISYVEPFDTLGEAKFKYLELKDDGYTNPMNDDLAIYDGRGILINSITQEEL